MKRIPIAIVGAEAGLPIARALLLGDGRASFELAGVCDEKRDLAKQAAKELDVRAYAGLDEVLGRSRIAAVGLFTPAEGRAKLVSRLVRAGKHVMTSCPFECDPEAAMLALRDARAMGRVVQVDSPAPLPDEAMQQMAAWRGEVDLGRPVACRAEIRAELPGASSALCLAMRPINELVRLFGAADRVAVIGSRTDPPAAEPRRVQMVIEFHGGILGSVYATVAEDGAGDGMWMTLDYEQGTIERAPGAASRGRQVAGIAMTLRARDGSRRIEKRATVEPPGGGHPWESFCRAIQGEKLQGAITAAHVVEGLRILRAARESMGSGGFGSC